MSVEKRKYIRHPSGIPIVCEIVAEAASEFNTSLRNISIGGLCFQLDCYLEKQTFVRIMIDLVRPVFQGQARVVWCQLNADHHYDVGVQFLDENTGARARIVEQLCHIEDYKQRVLEHEGRMLSGEEAALEWIDKYADQFPGT